MLFVFNIKKQKQIKSIQNSSSELRMTQSSNNQKSNISKSAPKNFSESVIDSGLFILFNTLAESVK